MKENDTLRQNTNTEDIGSIVLQSFHVISHGSNLHRLLTVHNLFDADQIARMPRLIRVFGVRTLTYNKAHYPFHIKAALSQFIFITNAIWRLFCI